MPLSFPLINGNRYDYTSIEILIEGVPYRGVKSIDYSDSLEAAKVYGTSARPLGRMRGKYDADGSIEVYKEEATIIRALLAGLGGGGFGEANFTIMVAYFEPAASAPSFDKLSGCRIKKIQDSHSQGSDSITEKWDLDIMEISRNGVTLLSNLQYVK